ncbi:MAG TPA: glycine--tRNA ligase [Candidatus Nanoarchaeia archaeon]|nr:glycine--tRNA ligase [Candidatus Nanoarchaeia archaeon]
MKNEQFLTDFHAFMQNKGFIYGPFPDIYNGVAGFYAYGPLGKLLKNKVENSVRKLFFQHGLRELECPTVVPDIVWEASGHLKTFTDKVITCSKCASVFRVDKLIEEYTKEETAGKKEKELLTIITKHKITCPSCKGTLKQEIKDYNLMMKTEVAGKPFSLRPETATVTYLPFKQLNNYFRKLPFGVFQIGKAYRNEISPRQHLLRLREFTQAEAQLFIDPKEKNNWEPYEQIKNKKLPLYTNHHQENKKELEEITPEEAIKHQHIKTKAYAWCLYTAYNQFLHMGIPEEKIRIRQHLPTERAFYADDAWDIEINLNSYGWTECCGVHDRTDYDLKKHAEFSKQKLEGTRDNGEKYIPHILEIAFGTDRPVFALMDLYYNKKAEGEGKTMFSLPYHITPIEIAVFPLMKKDGLAEQATIIKQELEQEFIVDYDEAGSIGKRYLRAAEAGTPYCITIDYDSLKNKDVTLRDRDTEKQIRIPIKELKIILHKLFKKEITFEKAGKLL